MKTTVHNIRTYTGNNGVYIGRSNELYHFGNPFSHKNSRLSTITVVTAEEAVVAFRQWILRLKYCDIDPDRRDWILKNLESLQGKDLLCFCKKVGDEPCHGDVLAELADEGEL